MCTLYVNIENFSFVTKNRSSYYDAGVADQKKKNSVYCIRNRKIEKKKKKEENVYDEYTVTVLSG